MIISIPLFIYNMKTPAKDVKLLFPLWKKHPVVELDRLKYLGLTKRDVDFALASLTEYLGGPYVVMNMVKEMLSKTFIGKDGGYDFKFKITDYKIYTDYSSGYKQLYLDNITAEVDRKGQVTLHAFEAQPTVSFDYLYNEMDVETDFIWDVGHEITDIIADTLVNEITKKTGTKITTSGIDFTFNDPSEFSAPIQENINKIKRLL